MKITDICNSQLHEFIATGAGTKPAARLEAKLSHRLSKVIPQTLTKDWRGADLIGRTDKESVIGEPRSSERNQTGSVPNPSEPYTREGGRAYTNRTKLIYLLKGPADPDIWGQETVGEGRDGEHGILAVTTLHMTSAANGANRQRTIGTIPRDRFGEGPQRARKDHLGLASGWDTTRRPIQKLLAQY